MDDFYDYDLDHGIDDTDDSIIERVHMPISSRTIKKEEKLVNNYFCPNHELIKIRLNNNITNDNMYNTFGNPYLICLKNGVKFESYYYNNIVTESQFDTIMKSVDIIPISYKIITSSALKYLTSISSEKFNTLNVLNKYGSNITIDKDVLLCCLLRFNRMNIDRYLMQFDGISEFIDLYNSVIINEYLGQYNKTSTVRQNHIRMINNMTESNYYTVHNNCQLNITLKFKSRSFNLSLSDRLFDETVQNVLKKLSESNEDNNYLAFLFKKASYLDASSAINSSGYKLYRITYNQLTNTMTNNDFNTLYNKLSFAERYHLIMNCMCSKELCHYVVNNNYILDEIISSKKDLNGYTFMNKYAQLIRYFLGYSWLTMYMEESIKRTYITKNDRFIFDIDTASRLPYYPYSSYNLHICPYLPILVESESLNTDKNILGAQQFIFDGSNEIKRQTRYGVCDKDTFIKRVNMFVSGLSENNNILEGVNWNNIAMSGSMMACCLPNFNTLMCNFMSEKTVDSMDLDFIGFIKEYYSEADIDVMCNIHDIHGYVDKINEFKNTIDSNIRKIHKLNSDVIISAIYSNKTAAIMINKEFINSVLVPELNMDYVTILSNVNHIKIKTVIYKHYIQHYKDELPKLIKDNPDKFTDPKYHEIYLPVSIENINVIFIKTKINKLEDMKKDVEEKEETDNNIENEDKEFDKENQYDDLVDEEYQKSNVVFIPKINYKYRINSPYLQHSFEFFQIKYDEFFSTVARFHLPIVRGYYNGENVYLTPSSISACMTLLNIDYKYFAGSKDPIEIINKYRMRGFGTILNDREIMRLIEYTDLVPKWKQKYGLNIKSNSSVMEILGQLSLSSHLYKRDGRIIKNEYTIIPKNLADIFKVIKNIYNTSNIDDNFNLQDLLTINKYGYVNPVKKWLIDAFNDYSFNDLNTIKNN